MNRWLIRAPWWALALINGVILAPFFMVIVHVGKHMPWSEALVSGVVTGAICGAILATFVRAQHRHQLDSVGDVSEELRTKVASRGTLRGPIPDDPAEREATRRLLEAQLERIRRRRPRGVLLNLVLISACVWKALVSSPWWWAAAALFVVLMFVGLVVTPHLGQRRIKQLSRG